MSINGSSNSSNSSNSNISNSNMSTQTNKITPETMVGSTSLLGLMRNNAPKENGIRKTGINGKEACSYLRMLVINPESQFHGLEITNILFPALVSEVGEEDVWSETKFYRLNNAANSSRWTWTLATRNNRRKSSSNGGKRRGKKQVEFKPMTFRSNDGETKDAGRTYGYGYGEQYTLRQMIEACHMDKFNGQPNLECVAKSKNIQEGLDACLKDDEDTPTSQELEDAEVAFWEKCIRGSANNEGSSSTTTTTTKTSVWSRFDVTDVLRDYPFNVQRMLLKLFVKHIEDMDESTGKMLLDAYRKMILEDSKRIEEFERQACYQINKVTDGIFKGQRRALDALGIESVEHPDKPKGEAYGKEVNGKRKLGYLTTGNNWKPLSNHRLAWVCDPNGPKNLFMTEVTSTGAEALGINLSSSSESSSSSDDDDDESEDESKKKKKKKQVESSEEDSNKESSEEESSEEESSEDESSEDEQAKLKKKKKKKQQEEEVVDDDDEDDEEEEDNEDDEEEEVTKQAKSKKKKKKKKEDNEDDEDDEEEVVEEEEEEDQQRTKNYEKHTVATLKKFYKTEYQKNYGQTPSKENWPNKAALVKAIMELVQVNEEEESTDGSSSKKRKRDEEVDFENMKLSELTAAYRVYFPSGRTPKKTRMIQKIKESQQ